MGALKALVNEEADDTVDVVVRSWPEASRMFTVHERRLRAAEAVTKPINKIYRTVKWGGLLAALAILSGASPDSVLGHVVQLVASNLK